jgi:hypothetical protein
MNLLWDSITPHDIGMYAIATIASVGVELLAFFRETAASGKVPDRYKNPLFVFGRIAFAAIAAGPLAVILDAESKVSAFYIGVSAPLIFDRLAAGMEPLPPVGSAHTPSPGEQAGHPHR